MLTLKMYQYLLYDLKVMNDSINSESKAYVEMFLAG